MIFISDVGIHKALHLASVHWLAVFVCCVHSLGQTILLYFTKCDGYRHRDVSQIETFLTIVMPNRILYCVFLFFYSNLKSFNVNLSFTLASQFWSTKEGEVRLINTDFWIMYGFEQISPKKVKVWNRNSKRATMSHPKMYYCPYWHARK